MNSIVSYVIEVVLSLIVSVVVVGYLRPFLRTVLVDLCGTQERAQFWIAFSNILLIGFPMTLALTYKPEATRFEPLFFELLGRLAGNIVGLMFALVGTGFVVAFFALFAPRPPKVESK